ncbi:alpha/beta fold hydrolase [Millisia brevis]|uniref:alpha/beta fold hydrolase n=1 Tax=Millisia brevis TaxID=264148 RepID=UPI0009FC43B1|nr:alpha/beta fold hydrolase [Millisia brevis]
MTVPSSSTRVTTFDRDDLTFDVIDSGPLDASTSPVVLLHGFPQRAASWSAVTERLNAAGYRTFAPDQRGYSPGARPTARGAYRIDDLTEDIVALIDVIGEPVHLVGHDWGAMVAWALAARRPDLIRSLTAISVPHPGAFIAAMPRGQILRSFYMGVFQLPVLPELAARRAPGLMRKSLIATGMSAAEADRVMTDTVEDGALTGGLNYYRAMPLYGRSSSVGRVRVPTTYVWSSGDVALGRHAAMTTGGYVRAPYRLIVLPGSHWIPDQQPQAVADAVLERARSVEDAPLRATSVDDTPQPAVAGSDESVRSSTSPE